MTYDPAAPMVVITTPTTATSFTTGTTPITLGGTASDDVSVTSVTWSSDQAVVPSSGPATGTDAWSASLGLALSRYWAECLGGRLTLGHGRQNGVHLARFELSLPCEPVG